MKALALAFLLLAGCDQAMRDQPKVKTSGASAFYADGAGARPIPAGTVARGSLRGEDQPYPIERRDLERGRERYGIFCAPCHSATGDGDGMVARRGFPRPASFHDPRLVEATDDQLRAVIRDGKGRMPPHGYLVPPDDRRRIVAYVRALQLSRRVPLARLRPFELAELEKEPR